MKVMFDRMALEPGIMRGHGSWCVYPEEVEMAPSKAWCSRNHKAPMDRRAPNGSSVTMAE